MKLKKMLFQGTWLAQSVELLSTLKSAHPLSLK